MTAIGPLRWQQAMASSVLMRNLYTKKRIIFIPNEVISKIYPYPNPFKPSRKARAEGGTPLSVDPSLGSSRWRFSPAMDSRQDLTTTGDTMTEGR
jgi:hypothetical protein